MVKFLLRVQEAPVRFRAAPAMYFFLSPIFRSSSVAFFCALPAEVAFFRAIVSRTRRARALFSSLVSFFLIF